MNDDIISQILKKYSKIKRSLKRSIKTENCPDNETLFSYISSFKDDEIGQHIASCAYCIEKIATFSSILDDKDDDLLPEPPEKLIKSIISTIDALTQDEVVSFVKIKFNKMNLVTGDMVKNIQLSQDLIRFEILDLGITIEKTNDFYILKIKPRGNIKTIVIKDKSGSILGGPFKNPKNMLTLHKIKKGIYNISYFSPEEKHFLIYLKIL